MSNIFAENPNLICMPKKVEFSTIKKKTKKRKVFSPIRVRKVDERAKRVDKERFERLSEIHRNAVVSPEGMKRRMDGLKKYYKELRESGKGRPEIGKKMMENLGYDDKVYDRPNDYCGVVTREQLDKM